jgi:RNA polymerase sigma factor (sigma-70 family)
LGLTTQKEEQMPADWNQQIPTRKSLLSRLKHRDDQNIWQASWQDFYDIYSRLIYVTAIQAGLREAEAEEVVQDTVIAVDKAIGRFEYQPEKCKFKTWLHAITRRQVANQFRKRQGKGRLLESLPGQDEGGETVNDIPDPASQALDETWDREWERNLLDAAAERVKRRVSPAHYQIFEYHALQGHGVSQTAKALGISAAKVYLVKHRIARQVREEVAYLRTNYL